MMHRAASVTGMIAAAGALLGCQPSGQRQGAGKSSQFVFEGGEVSAPVKRLTHGKRLVRVLACQGCHGETLQGENATADDPDFGEMNAPNITLLLPEYSDAQLERLIRHGVPRDGRTFWFMSSEGFQFLGDRDLDALIGYLRTLRPEGRQMPPLKFGEGFRRAQKTREIEPVPKLVVRFAREAPVDLGPKHAYGRWLARTICAECHNAALQGFEDFTPNLDIAGAYTAAQLDRLLTTGIGISSSNLGIMAKTARSRLGQLTPSERRALIAYVLARADYNIGSRAPRSNSTNPSDRH